MKQKKGYAPTRLTMTLTQRRRFLPEDNFPCPRCGSKDSAKIRQVQVEKSLDVVETMSCGWCGLRMEHVEPPMEDRYGGKHPHFRDMADVYNGFVGTIKEPPKPPPVSGRE